LRGGGTVKKRLVKGKTDEGGKSKRGGLSKVPEVKSKHR